MVKKLGQKYICFIEQRIIWSRAFACYETAKGVYFMNRNRRTYVKPHGTYSMPNWVERQRDQHDYEYDCTGVASYVD